MELLLDSVKHVESGGNPYAVSPKGAQGPYQFMPDTAAEYGVKDPFNESEARDGARRYLTKLIDMFDGDVDKAVAAYNGGPGRMQKVGSIGKMPAESQAYVPKVMSKYAELVMNTGENQFDNQESQPASMVESLFPGTQGQREASVSALFKNNREDDALRANVLDPKPVDQAARVYDMQLRTGLPAGLIERNLDEIEQKTKEADFDPESFRRQSPLLAEWLSKNTASASLAQGDYENLSALEKSWATLKAVPSGFGQGYDQERLMNLSYKAATGEITPAEQLERSKLKEDMRKQDQLYDEGAPSWTKEAGKVLGQNLPMLGKALKEGVKFGIPAGAVLGASTGTIAGPPGSLAGAAAGATAGLSAATQASYIDQTYKLSVGEAFDELEGVKDASGNAIDPHVARYASQLVAFPNAIFEFASMRTALKLIPGADKVVGKLTTQEMKQILVRPTVQAALVDFGKKYGAAVGTETFTEGLQTFTTIIAREIATGDMGEGLSKADAENVVDSSTAAFKGSVVLGLLPSGPKVIELYADMEKAAQNEEFMHSLGDVAATSKTMGNSPKAFGDYVKHLKDNNGIIKNVFVPIESWNLLFQDGAPNAAKEVFGSSEQYAEAQATGSDLVIPIETYAEKLAGTQFHESLVPHIRLGPGEMTPTEAAQAEKETPAIVAGLEAEMAVTIAEETPLAMVYKDVYDKLRQSGASQQEANRDATLWRERLRARAERLGIDPVQLYQDQPLTLMREYPVDVAEGLVVYNQQLAEPAVPYAQRLPLEGGEINLPPATQQERAASSEAITQALESQKAYGVAGATIHPVKGNLSGTEGVAVAGYPQRGVITDGMPTEQELEVFQRKNRDIFQADPNAALGIWLDNETGKGYIDITNVLPRDLAIAQGERLGEIAVWDLGAGEEIRIADQKQDAGQGVLFQGKERGASVPIKKMIALLQGADASTFAHESAHIWLEELRADALRPDAPAQLKSDWETIKEWSGAEDDAISTEAHETFARGFEAYLMEGKAPSFQLRQVFAQLKDWLKRIYQSMQMLDVKLTQDVSDVMDRLIATDEAIKQAHERNSYDVKLLSETDMSGAEYAAYNALGEEAKLKAEDHFRAKIMKELRREKTQKWRDEKKALTPIVRAEVLSEPIYRASYWLYAGVLPDGTQIEGLTSHKLDSQALIDLGISPSQLPFRHEKGGLHPDVVAEMFGFPSGESLVRELVTLPRLNETIDNEVNNRIRKKHGGIIVEGVSDIEVAMEVQNTQQVDMFNMELRILKRLGAKREITHTAILKDIAQQIISRQKIGQLEPRLYEQAALRAGQEAQDAMLGHEFRMGTGRNLDVAFDATQKRLLNIFLFKEATAKKLEAEKSVKYWKKTFAKGNEKLAKTHDMNMFNTARAIASVHGIGGSEDTAAAYMRAMMQYDPDTYNDMREVVELASGDGRTVDDLTVADFGMVKDAIDGMLALSRRTRQIEIDGKKLERDEVIGELNTQIGMLVKPGKEKAGYKQAVSNWEKTKMGFLGVRGMVRRVEHWVDAMDVGDPNGVFRKYIWQPISEAADVYRDHRRQMLEKYEEIAKSVPKETFKQGKIDAYEIGYVFRDKTELIGALLHTGNKSNLQKLLVGRDWGVMNNGELDSRDWDVFIKRMHDTGTLTQADYEFAQKVWDLMNDMKPAAQQAHKEMYGFYFNEITAQPIDTPWGTFAGGYYPATVDTFMIEDAAIRAEKEALESRPSGFMFPTTGRGFTKQRSEMYAKPLLLDVGLIPGHIEKVLRFTYIEPRVKDVGRVAINKNFRQHLSVLDSEIASSMLMPWLQRTALQMVEQPSGPRMRMLDSFFHAVRANTGLQLMVANVSVALQQIPGLAMAMLKVKPRYMSGALWRYTSGPRDYTQHVNDSSTFMRNRLSSQIFEIRRSIDEITLNPSKYKKAKDFVNAHGYFMQTGVQNVVDMITWGGAYEQATQNGADEKSAIRQADSAVRETQGTFHADDISRFEAGPAYLRVFSMFYSYFNMAANLNGTEFAKAMRLNGFAAGGRALYIYTFGMLIPAVVSEAIVQAVSGEAFDDDDDDGYLDNLLSIFFGGQSKMATAMIPVLGPMTQTGINMFNNKWYDDRIGVSPAVSTMESVARIPYDAWKVATDEEAALKRPIKDVLTTVGMVTGLPVAPLAKPIGYLTDIQQGVIEEPDNPLEFTRGLISGKAPK